MYQLIRPFLFLLDSETAHNAMVRMGEFVGRRAWLAGALAKLYAFEDPRLAVRAFGTDFKNPVGLAAGFDKNARLLGLLSALGFGFAEVGTVTPRPQAGNPRPRLFRLSPDLALLNRLGFNSEGARAVRERIFGAKLSLPFGVNIGKNKDTPNEQAIGDYAKDFSELADRGDYITVNVSSPNTPNLRALQDKETLRPLLLHLQTLNASRQSPKPLLLKIAPDLTNEALDDIVAIVRETGIAGVIATNTTISREGLRTDPAEIAALGAGGVSGKPLAERSTEVIRYLYKKLGARVPIVGVGGVFTAEDAYEKICAGASLVQMYTGLIYEGPGVVKRVKRGLVRLLARDGFKSISEAVGSSNRE